LKEAVCRLINGDGDLLGAQTERRAMPNRWGLLGDKQYRPFLLFRAGIAHHKAVPASPTQRI
jgi:hypothetical protein